jgi:predicted nucleic acid-binding protein
VKPVLADTGFLVAVYNQRERHHSICVRVHHSLDNPLATCEPVIAEALHLLRFTPGAAEGILASVQAGILEIPFNLSESAAPVSRIMKKYHDLKADFADACLIHMADKLDTGDILTLDGDFAHYRWRRNRPFHLLIPLE